MDADAKALEVVAQHMQTTGTKVDLDILIAHALRQAHAEGMREAAEITRILKNHRLLGDHSEEAAQVPSLCLLELERVIQIIAAAIERAAEAEKEK